jgi:N-acetylmuramoyl-L-alanine amidase
MNMHCAKLPILREFKKNDFLLKLLVVLVVLFTCSKLFPLYSQQIKTVVIDAGHGGKDPGCHGNFAFEKDVCLSMALKLGSLIKAKYPEIKIIYTRDQDVFVELIERANIANRAKADLFICIHANAGTEGAYGTETYVLGLHRTEAQQRVAERENSIIALEDDKGAKYKEIDLSADAIIVRQLQLKVFLDHSILFAEKLQKAFKKFGRYDRGVKQAGFLVLYKTTMPSVLIETGFLTNPNEEKFLGNITGQVNMADLMFNAFENYRNQIENKIPPHV